MFSDSWSAPWGPGSQGRHLLPCLRCLFLAVGAPKTPQSRTPAGVQPGRDEKTSGWCKACLLNAGDSRSVSPSSRVEWSCFRYQLPLSLQSRRGKRNQPPNGNTKDFTETMEKISQCHEFKHFPDFRVVINICKVSLKNQELEWFRYIKLPHTPLEIKMGTLPSLCWDLAPDSKTSF